jgi:hypothetical protein
MSLLTARIRVGEAEPHEVEIQAGLWGRRVVLVDGREILNVAQSGGRLSFEVGTEEVHRVEIRPRHALSLVQECWVDGRLADRSFLDLETVLYASAWIRALSWLCVFLGTGVAFAWIAGERAWIRPRPEDLVPVAPGGWMVWFAEWGLILGVGLTALGFLEVLEIRLHRSGRRAGVLLSGVVLACPILLTEIGQETWRLMFGEDVYLAGVAAEEAEDPRGALTEYNRLLSCGLYRDDPDLHYRRGRTLASLGELSLALAAYDETLRLNPAYALAHEGRAYALEALGNPEGAEASLQKALDAAAPTWEGQGRVKERLEGLRKSRKADPK